MYLFTDPINKSYAECPRIQVKDSTNINKANFRPDLNPNNNCLLYSNFKVKQSNGINANCLVDSLMRNIGSDQIKAKINQKCRNANPSHVVPVQSVVVPTCDLRVVQGATDLSACMINELQKIAIESESKSKSKFVPETKPSYIFFIIIFMMIMIFVIYLISN